MEDVLGDFGADWGFGDNTAVPFGEGTKVEGGTGTWEVISSFISWHISHSIGNKFPISWKNNAYNMWKWLSLLASAGSEPCCRPAEGIPTSRAYWVMQREQTKQSPVYCFANGSESRPGASWGEKKGGGGWEARGGNQLRQTHQSP